MSTKEQKEPKTTHVVFGTSRYNVESSLIDQNFYHLVKMNSKTHKFIQKHFCFDDIFIDHDDGKGPYGYCCGMNSVTKKEFNLLKDTAELDCHWLFMPNISINDEDACVKGINPHIKSKHYKKITEMECCDGDIEHFPFVKDQLVCIEKFIEEIEFLFEEWM